MTIKEKIEMIKNNRLSNDEISIIEEKMDELIRYTDRPLTNDEYVFFEKHLYLFHDEHNYFFKWSVIFNKTKLIEIIVEHYNPNDDIEYSKEEIEFCLNDGYYRNVYSYVKYGFVMTYEYITELKNQFKNDIDKKEIYAVLNRIKKIQKYKYEIK